MKLISSDRERTWYLVDEFVTKVKLNARILKCEWNNSVMRLAPTSLHPFFTGYVQKREGDTTKYYDNPKIDVHGGVTFEGKHKGLNHDAPGEWVGFDMAHYGDEDMQDINYAKEQCEELAKQML